MITIKTIKENDNYTIIVRCDEDGKFIVLSFSLLDFNKVGPMITFLTRKAKEKMELYKKEKPNLTKKEHKEYYKDFHYKEELKQIYEERTI